MTKMEEAHLLYPRSNLCDVFDRYIRSGGTPAKNARFLTECTSARSNPDDDAMLVYKAIGRCLPTRSECNKTLRAETNANHVWSMKR